MVVFQKLEGKTTTLKFWNKKLEGKTTTLMFWNQKMEGKTTTPKNCVLTSFLHERSRIFFLVFSLVRFWILLRNVYFCTMDGFFRILKKVLSKLICTRLYVSSLKLYGTYLFVWGHDESTFRCIVHEWKKEGKKESNERLNNTCKATIR